LLILLLIHKST